MKMLVLTITLAGIVATPCVVAGEWSAAASMNTPRQYPGLARLADGRILAVTGHPLGGQSLSSAEIYDPAKDTWTPTGSLNVARNGVGTEGLAVLGDGRVLIAGGGTGSRSADEVELFDPETETWSLTGAMREARSNHTMTVLPDGRVLVTGGIDWTTDEVLDSAEIFDPTTGSWTQTRPMSGPRTNHGAVALSNGLVLIAGGAAESDVAGELPTAELFNPVTLTFRMTGVMREARRAFRLILLSDGRALAVGGALASPGGRSNELAGVELFDPETERWSDAAPLLEARWGATATVLRDGRVLVTGGMYGRAGRRRSVEIYDPAVDAWVTGAPLQQTRNGHRDSVLDDGRVLIVGGFSGRDYLTSCEVYAE